MANTQHVVDDLESLVSGGEVDGSDVRDLGEFGGGIVYFLLVSKQILMGYVDILHFKNVKTGMTPEGAMYMTSSSFHTENC